MSGICGWVGEADPAVLDAMLDAIDYRGDRIDKAVAPGVALGYAGGVGVRANRRAFIGTASIWWLVRAPLRRPRNRPQRH